MVEIVPATKEEFGDHSGARPRREETKRVKAMAVDEVIRIKEHDHTMSGGTCRLAKVLNTAARLDGIQIATRHDGADLLVMRVK